MCLVESLNLLIDKHGWSAVLEALEQIAKTDGFSQLSAAIRPVIDLIRDDHSESPAKREN